MGILCGVSALYGFWHCLTTDVVIMEAKKADAQTMELIEEACFYCLLAQLVNITSSILDCLSTLNIWIVHIRESVDSLCRDGADTPIVCVH